MSTCAGGWLCREHSFRETDVVEGNSFRCDTDATSLKKSGSRYLVFLNFQLLESPVRRDNEKTTSTGKCIVHADRNCY